MKNEQVLTTMKAFIASQNLQQNNSIKINSMAYTLLDEKGEANKGEITAEQVFSEYVFTEEKELVGETLQIVEIQEKEQEAVKDFIVEQKVEVVDLPKSVEEEETKKLVNSLQKPEQKQTIVDKLKGLLRNGEEKK